jgi:lipopolysaccharide transport system ATP-binding protein
MKPIIQARGLGKRYCIGAARAPYGSLRESLVEAVMSPFRRLRRNAAPREETIWALKDVDLDIMPGEAVGVIGRNGAGKSTLLKVLSRITEPTTGSADLYGRVGCLLEVGTGFHPELTGRDNVYLNGAVLGMRRREITRKFDSIVAFAEVEKFLDTPVKFYSSGMYMRLAFSVAAHLDPEILIIDEVLAVGDAEFQRRCLGKMSEVAREGRTVLFVSHHMPSVTRLCRRAIWMDAGSTVLDGDPAEVTSRYLHSESGTSAHRHWDELATAPGDRIAKLRLVRVLQDGVVSDTVDIRRPVTVEMEYWVLEPGRRLIPALLFYDDHGVLLFYGAPFGTDPEAAPQPVGLVRVSCTIPGNLFAECRVRVWAEVSTRFPLYQVHMLAPDAVAFQVVDSGEPGSVRAGWGGAIPGMLRPMLSWTSEHHAEVPPAAPASSSRGSGGG